MVHFCFVCDEVHDDGVLHPHSLNYNVAVHESESGSKLVSPTFYRRFCTPCDKWHSSDHPHFETKFKYTAYPLEPHKKYQAVEVDEKYEVYPAKSPHLDMSLDMSKQFSDAIIQKLQWECDAKHIVKAKDWKIEAELTEDAKKILKPLLVMPKSFVTTVPIQYPNKRRKKPVPPLVPIVASTPPRRQIDFAEPGCYLAPSDRSTRKPNGGDRVSKGKGKDSMPPKGMPPKGKGKGCK
jgi:hypothetical protein